MGTDIHLCVEVRRDGIWHAVTGANPWKTRNRGEPDLSYHWLYDNRNYDLFGMLADVRNGRGFAGLDTGDGFTPIMACRGLPADMSDELRSELDNGRDVWLGDHSFSWLTLSELASYDWQGQSTRKRGVVNGEEYLARDRNTGEPPNYRAAISGPGIVHISENEMKERLASGLPTLNHYCVVEWETTYYDCVRDFVDVIPKLATLGRPDDVRIVFGFDS